MAETYVQAEKDYVKGMKYKDIAEKYNVSINTVKSWKRRYGWERKKGAPKQKSVHTKKGGQPGNQNSRGHGAPKKNSNAITHGLFAKYLPQETLNIVNEMGNSLSLIDILWANIQMQFASILRAQKIMHVESKDEMIKEIKKEKEFSSDTGGGSETEWEFQFAWDRQATFMNSLSRSMGELRSMLKQFVELADRDDMRLLEIQKMKLSISKTEKEIENISGGGEADELDDWVQAMGELDEQD